MGLDFGALGADVVRMESDDELRKRLVYVAGDSDAQVHRISRASGSELDQMAEECGLKRRRL